MFKMTFQELNIFYQLLQDTKEYGGVFKIENNHIINKTHTRGDNYSISYNTKNASYQVSYHTHAYYCRLKHLPQIQVMKRIKNEMEKNMNDALFMFETDIMKVHPPSPQDCYICSLKRKHGMIIFTQEGIYELTYHKPYPLSMNDKDKIDELYYTCMWGKSKDYVTKQLVSHNKKSIMTCLRYCMKHRKQTPYRKSIQKYLNHLQKYGFQCQCVPWKSAHTHVFFSPKV